MAALLGDEMQNPFEQWVANEIAALSGNLNGQPMTPGAMAESAAFRSFLADLIGNPMPPTQPCRVALLHLSKKLGLTMSCAVLERSLYFRGA